MAVSRPQTRQFEAFMTNLSYARRMVKAGRILTPFRSPTIDIDDFYRAAWVQAVAALDHWLHEEVLRRVAELTAQDSPEMPHQLRRYELPLHRVEAVRRGEVTLSEAVVEHLRDKLAVQALQHPGKIAEVLKLVTEKKVWYEAAGCINKEFFQGRTTFNEKTLRGRYLEITQRRNKIAHDADLIDGDLKQRRPIDEAEVTDAIDWIERIALAIAHVLDDRG
jgi:restriction system protein